MGRGRVRHHRLVGLAIVGITVVALSGCILGETGDARIVSDGAATLEGRLFSNEPGQGDYWFEYGTTTAYGQSTDPLSKEVQDDGWVQVSRRVEGLDPGTVYHYRLCGEGGPGPHGRCGEDRSFTTGVGRVTITGEASYWDGTTGATASVEAAADAPGPYVDGTAEYAGVVETPTHPPVGWGGMGPVTCLRVQGNLATVGFFWNDPILGSVDGLLVIEDNGPTGDRFDLWIDVYSSCPTPDPSLISAGTGAVLSGDIVIDGA